MAIRYVIFSLVLAISVSSAAQGNCTKIDSSSRPDCPQALAFFSRIQDALRRNDRNTLSSFVHYPLRATLNHKTVLIHNRKCFLTHFDEIFDAGVRCAVLNASTKDVWGNWQGFTVDGGVLWFEGVIPPGENPDIDAPDFWTKYPLKIKTVNNDAYYPCASP